MNRNDTIDDRKNIWSRKTAKTPTYNAFYASKLQDYVEDCHCSFRIV